MIIVKS